MRREIARLQLTPVVALFVATFLMLGSISGDAAAGVRSFSGQISGPGTSAPGKRVSLAVSLVAHQPKSVPPLRRISSIAVLPYGIGIHPSARGIGMCRSGAVARCPRSSRVGSGIISGFLATPSGGRTEFGALSRFKGRMTVYNTRPKPQQVAKLLVRLETSRPIRGLTMTTSATINEFRVLQLKVPQLKNLPEWIRRSYPPDTRVILDRFDVRLSSSARRDVRPLLTMATPGKFGVSVVVSE